MTAGTKKSNFLAWGNNTIPDAATFDFVNSNTNYKISFQNLVNNLGVTGSIEQDGAVTGTPILDVQGAVNAIRNLEDGSGIKTSVSAENGATIEHDFIEDTSGVELVVDLAAKQPKFRSLVAGAGINVAATNGTIQIALSGTPASTKTVIVNQISDFPAPVAGVITLDANTEYAVRNDISTTNRFVFGDNTVISGSDDAVVNLEYTGVGDMFTGSNVTAKIKNITITCSSGTFINFTGTGTEIFQTVDAKIVADTLGTMGDIAGIQLTSTQVDVTTDGLVFTGSNGVALISASLDIIDAGTLFDLGTSTFNGISFTDCFVTLNGSSVFLSGLANSGNINTGALGSVHNCRFFGTGTPLNTINDEDIRWQFFINDDIQETHKDALISLSGNLTATTITAVNTPTLIAGTWTEEHGAQFTTDANGRMTYIGVKDTHFDVTCSFSVEPVSGTNKEIGLYVAKNGTEISNSEATANVSAGDPKRVTTIWRLTLSTNDYIEAFVENETDATDILVSDAVQRIS